MVSQKVTINNPQGLHMRPAGVFAKGMAKFDSGSEVEIQCDGADEEEALKTAIEMIESGLGE